MAEQSKDSSPGPLPRRVVTGNASDGTSKILYDDQGGNILNLESGGKFHSPWWTDSVPADCSTATYEDPTGHRDFFVSNKGSVATFVWVPPNAAVTIHTTKSMDYGLILEGEIKLELENGDKTVLKAGDLVIQRETNHAWYSRHLTQWVEIFFVLVASTNAVNDA
ncbi:hypothetical protein M422DRAFT_276647 [Sphaerobolus stellatus SS14]|uniref:Cupin 2 conserved barrel domain-containing protein n=1 Tax=Sphaerobolus stellatus (strain SS14) TaxID=990650 RepID=A0A0C9TM03_SPHS4|nr:hypothetical protein M422DRAFT_276647 [Sphaerobolus stellatus SS14]